MDNGLLLVSLIHRAEPPAPRIQTTPPKPKRSWADALRALFSQRIKVHG